MPTACLHAEEDGGGGYSSVIQEREYPAAKWPLCHRQQPMAYLHTWGPAYCPYLQTASSLKTCKIVGTNFVNSLKINAMCGRFILFDRSVLDHVESWRLAWP